jgi:hypothetical protein
MKIGLKVDKHVKTLSMEEHQGKEQLSGIIGLYWFFIVVFSVILVGVIGDSVLGTGIRDYGLTDRILTIMLYMIILALYIIPLVGVVKRKSYAVPYTRAMLIITMFFIPIGTIIGARLWKRINHPATKQYLNYKIMRHKTAPETTAPETTAPETTAKYKIAFYSNRDGKNEIYIMNDDGSEQVRLTNDPPNGNGGPSFSPDGSKIAFNSERDGNSEIYIMNIDGSEQVNLTNNPANDGKPSFSPIQETLQH